MFELKNLSHLDFDKKMILFWLLIFSLIGLIYLAILGFNPVYGETFVNNVSIKKFDNIRDGEYRVYIKYCKETNSNPLGIMVSSTFESVSIPIRQNLEEGKCGTYAARIQAESKMTIKTLTFQSEDLDSMIKQLEIKRKQLNDQLVFVEQKRIMKKSLDQDLDQKTDLGNKIEEIKSSLKSTRANLITLISLK